MPYCAILTCKNDSRTKNLSNGGVSYHRFPKDPFFKEKWIDATGRQNLMPSISSTLCSEHFDDENLQISKKGYRYMNENAIPNHKILIFQDQNDSEKNKPGPSRKRPRLKETPPLPKFISDTPTKKTCKNKASDLTNSPTHSRQRKLRMMLRWSQSKIRKQNLKIKLLQTRNRRLKRKIKNMEELLKSLEDKYEN